MRGGRAEALVLLPVAGGRPDVPVRRRGVLLARWRLGALGARSAAGRRAPAGIAAGIALGGVARPVAPRHPAAAWAGVGRGRSSPAGRLLAFGAEALIGAHCFAAGRYSDRRGRCWASWRSGARASCRAWSRTPSLVPFLLLAGPHGSRVGRCASARSSRPRWPSAPASSTEEQEAYAALAVRHERARIAAELHDIVAHAISVMVVQAGAGQRVAAADPALAGEAFAAIAGAARQAEDDMGRLVVLLWTTTRPGAASTRPTPTWRSSRTSSPTPRAAASTWRSGSRADATACRAPSPTPPTAWCRRA